MEKTNEERANGKRWWRIFHVNGYKRCDCGEFEQKKTQIFFSSSELSRENLMRLFELNDKLNRTV